MQMAPAIKKQSGVGVGLGWVGGDTQSGEHDILGELALLGFFFPGRFQKASRPCCILFIYRPDVVAAQCIEGIGVGMTQMLFRGACGLLVSLFCLDGEESSRWVWSP